jgi:hypothetical protein
MGENINDIGFIFSKVKSSVKCNKRKYVNCKIVVMELKKEDFVSSTLNISTSQQDAWDNFKVGLTNLINGLFVISVTKCDRLFSFGAKLIRIKVCKCCDIVHLYFNYNIIPNTTNNNCSGCTDICIPLTPSSAVPTTACLPQNYWPNTNAPYKSTDYNTPPSANVVGNFFFNVESTNYYDVKFYYNNEYCPNVCFANWIVCS